MRVLVTRPAAQATAWVQRLRAQGLDAEALPLIAIQGPPDPAAIDAAWATLGDRRLVVFVSPNAAEAFIAAAPPGAVWPAAVRVASPGPGTTAVLRGLGIAAGAIDEPAADAPQFDSEALWARLAPRDWSGASVLVVRGTRGRDWLGAKLGAAGARVEALAAYSRAAPVLAPAGRALLAAALERPRAHVWLFSSSESIDHLGTLVPAATDWERALAVATHPRIAARARELRIGSVFEARPTLAAVVACIQSIRP